MNTTKATIAIKYPKKYEDAQEIVELLIETNVFNRFSIYVGSASSSLS